MRSIFREKPDSAEARRATAGWRKVWVCFPVAIAVTVIALESTDTFSAQHTDEGLRPFFERIFGHINDHVWWWGHHLFRKSGHFAGYGLVCLTFLRAWLLTLACRVGMSLHGWRWRSVGLGIACTFAVASADEWHQTFIPSRTGAFADVVLDTFGGSVMCLMVWFLFWRQSVKT